MAGILQNVDAFHPRSLPSDPSDRCRLSGSVVSVGGSAGLGLGRSGQELCPSKLLIGTLATFISWLVGLAGEARDGLRQAQASSSSKRRTLSTVFVGRYWVLRSPSWLTLQALREAEKKLIIDIADRLCFVEIP